MSWVEGKAYPCRCLEHLPTPGHQGMKRKHFNLLLLCDVYPMYVLRMAGRE